MVITVVQNIMWVDMIQKINRFPRFSNEETSVLHNEMRYTTKFSPINWRYFSNFISGAANTAKPSKPTSSLWL